MDQQAEKDMTERITGLGRRTRAEIAKWNQITALRFQTGGETSDILGFPSGETASEIFGKHHEKKKRWVTAEILDPCNKRRELRKKRFEPEGSEKYREVNNNIRRCMKKAIENWTEEQCSEIEQNLRKNNSVRAYRPVKDLTTVKQGKATIVQDGSGKCLPEEREILNRWTEFCSELYNHRALRRSINTELSPDTQRMTTPFFAKKWGLQYNYCRKGSQLMLTASQQNWSKQVERM